MTRAYLKLYFLLILPILAMGLLPQNPLNLLTSWWISNDANYEYGAISSLMKEELNQLPHEQWPQRVKEISKFFAYQLELKTRQESGLKQSALSKLDQKDYLLIRYKGNKTLLYSMETDRENNREDNGFILYFSIEGNEEKLDELEKQTRGFRYFLNKKIQESDDIVTEFNRLKKFFSQELSIQKFKNFKADNKFHNTLLEKHVYNEIKGDDYYSYILSKNNEYLVIVKGKNKTKIFSTYYKYLSNLIPALLLALGAFIWLFLFRKELKTVKTAAIQLGQGNFETRAELSKSSTLYPIADSFNEMAVRIQSLIEGHKDLTNAVSHELKTPLSRLHFALEMQKESKTVAEREVYTQKIENNIASLENLVDELLSYTRMQRQQDIQLHTHNFKSWIEKVMSTFAEYHPEIKILCDVKVEEDILLDNHLMTRALNNLLDNAAQYCDTKNPKIKVTAKIISDRISLSVEDNGTGVKPDDYDNIFQPFTRLDKSRKRQDNKLNGYGMGLAIVKSIALQHKGTVTAERSNIDKQNSNESNSGGLRIILNWPMSKG